MHLAGTTGSSHACPGFYEAGYEPHETEADYRRLAMRNTVFELWVSFTPEKAEVNRLGF